MSMLLSVACADPCTIGGIGLEHVLAAVTAEPRRRTPHLVGAGGLVEHGLHGEHADGPDGVDLEVREGAGLRVTTASPSS